MTSQAALKLVAKGEGDKQRALEAALAQGTAVRKSSQKIEEELLVGGPEEGEED